MLVKSISSCTWNVLRFSSVNVYLSHDFVKILHRYYTRKRALWPIGGNLASTYIRALKCSPFTSTPRWASIKRLAGAKSSAEGAANQRQNESDQQDKADQQGENRADQQAGEMQEAAEYNARDAQSAHHQCDQDGNDYNEREDDGAGLIRLGTRPPGHLRLNGLVLRGT